YSRRFTILLSLALQTVFGVAVDFAPNFLLYVTIHFIITSTIFGVIINGFVLIPSTFKNFLNHSIDIEWTSTKRHMLAKIFTDYFFVLGYMLLADLAYLI
ncbi:hypothetical protein P4O66_019446, partial [Electrophorus voltai]